MKETVRRSEVRGAVRLMNSVPRKMTFGVKGELPLELQETSEVERLLSMPRSRGALK